METLNKSVKNIIQFILCVQDSCDKHRKCMEHLWLQEYTLYINERKHSEAESKVQSQKNHENNTSKATKCSQVCPKDSLEEFKELALADSLLKKARSIRSRSHKLINGLVDTEITCASHAVTCPVLPKYSDSSHSPRRSKIAKKIPQSNSDFIINSRLKRPVVPRSKSATIPFVPKNESKHFCDNKSSTSLLPKCSVANHTNSIEKISDDFNVISKKDLDLIKKLPQKVQTCHEHQEKKIVSSSDASENRKQLQISSHPSSKDFFSLIKGRLNTVSSHIKLKVWYPFLSPKSEAFLTAPQCNTFSSVKKIYSILYSIQETMMWIDLLYLMETEISPVLIVEINDVNMLRICSYLQSIYHPTSQRVPILNPNR